MRQKGTFPLVLISYKARLEHQFQVLVQIQRALPLMTDARMLAVDGDNSPPDLSFKSLLTDPLTISIPRAHGPTAVPLTSASSRERCSLRRRADTRLSRYSVPLRDDKQNCRPDRSTPCTRSKTCTSQHFLVPFPSQSLGTL